MLQQCFGTKHIVTIAAALVLIMVSISGLEPLHAELDMLMLDSYVGFEGLHAEAEYWGSCQIVLRDRAISCYGYNYVNHLSGDNPRFYCYIDFSMCDVGCYTSLGFL